jgi:hypothetical protein
MAELGYLLIGESDPRSQRKDGGVDGENGDRAAEPGAELVDDRRAEDVRFIDVEALRAIGGGESEVGQVRCLDVLLGLVPSL